MPAKSFSTFSTPSWVSASLSRVCEAASTYRFSHCLSLIRAWCRLASPWITLMKSYTTRRSQPMIRSRLRKPTSKSITAVLKPLRAGPVAKLALVVVLPSPPLPEVTTTIFAMEGLSVLRNGFERSAVPRRDHQLVALSCGLQRHLGCAATHFRRQGVFAGSVDAGDRNELGVHALRKDAGSSE